MAVLECPDLDGYGEGYGAEYGEGEAEYHAVILSLLPRGKAWTRRLCSNMSKFAAAIGAEFAFASEIRDDMVLESDPRQAYHSLDDWEELLGLPGNCEPTYPTDVAGRRLAIHARMITRGEQDPAFYIAIGVSLGYTDLTFSKYDAFTCTSECDDLLNGGQWQYAVHVEGTSSSSDAILQCMLDDAVPQHWTFVVDLT
jgi:uncharacterized protein YmfQ (DUF2313 family)